MTAVDDKPVALITGASSGIGEATARYFAARGWLVIIAARRQDLLDSIAADIRASGGECAVIAVDLADDKATSQLAEQALKIANRLDVLINNAGYGPPFALEQMSRDRLRHAFDVNILSGMQLIGELTPYWRKAGGGRVINVSSLTRYVSAPVASSYAGTKGAMESMTDCLRLELAPWHIRLSLVVPGFVDTPTFDKSREASKDMMEDPNNPYQRWMQRLDEFSMQQSGKAIAPMEVARVIYQAAVADKPGARYFVPVSSRIIAMVFGLLPARLVDSLLLRLYGWGK